MKKDANYWNNHWKKKPVVYNGRTLHLGTANIKVDVKNFILADDNVLKELIDIYKLKKPTHNETALACQKFVVEHIKYVDDEEQDKVGEFWMFPFETWVTKCGDCEDGAILMASLLINAGVPSYRVKVGAGFVQPQPTAPQGGHAYCMYLADRQNGQDWVALDWCYYEDSDIKPEDKPLLKDGGYMNTYKNIWFTFNNKYSWSNELVEVNSIK